MSLNNEKLAARFLNIQATCLVMAGQCESAIKELNVEKIKIKKDYQHILERRTKSRIRNAAKFHNQ